MAAVDAKEGARDGAVLRVHLVSTVQESRVAVELLGQSQLLALATDSCQRCRRGKLSLIQLAAPTGDVYVFDVLRQPALVSDGQLHRLLESDVIKVMHDSKEAGASLFFQFGIKLQGVFDAHAAHVALQHQNHGAHPHTVHKLSLANLSALYGGPTNPRGAKKRCSSGRPLAEDVVFHAAFDVFCLVPTVYNTLRDALRPETLPLFRELCEERLMANVSAGDVKERVTQRIAGCFKQRLDGARLTNTPVTAINREIRVLGRLNLTEEEISRIRADPRKIAKERYRLLKRAASAAANELAAISSVSSSSVAGPTASKRVKMSASAAGMIKSEMSPDAVSSSAAQTTFTGDVVYTKWFVEEKGRC